MASLGFSSQLFLQFHTRCSDGLQGAGKMDMRMFIVAGLIGRSIRFSAFSFGIVMFGEELVDILNIWTFTALGIAIGIASFPLLKWWNGLAEPENQPSSSD